MRSKLLLGLAGIVVGCALAAATSSSPNSTDVDRRLNNVRHELQSVKSGLKEMDCCNNPSCNFCPLAEGGCTCAHNVKTTTGVCGECYDGWRAGYGAVPGVDPKDVHRLSKDALLEMYRMKAQHFAKEH